MWPICFFFNKLLKVEDKVHGSDGQLPASAQHCCPLDYSTSSKKFYGAGLPSSHFVEVPHINQLSYWDCGLACVLMVLRTIGISNCDIEELAKLCCTTSIWTVDLAYLLQKFCVRFSYFTITYGVNPNYSVEAFYKDQLPADLVRVDMLFQKAPEAGINIKCRSISTGEISQLILSGSYIAIALVDQYKLSHSWLGKVFVSSFPSSNSSYAGHYVVICGYDAGADEFEIRDPASSGKCERVSSKCLENARKSFGTDEDLLLITLEKSERQNGCEAQTSQHY